MFEDQYNEEMEAEVRRLEGKRRAADAGHPDWENACAGCGCRLPVEMERCNECGPKTHAPPDSRCTPPGDSRDT